MKKKNVIIIAVIVTLAIGCAGGAYGYDKYKTNKMREAGNEVLTSSIELDDYRASEQKDVKKILASYEEKINMADEQEDVDAAISGAKDEISKIKTDAQLTAEEKAAEEAKRKAEEEAKKKAAEEEAKRIAAQKQAQKYKSSKSSSKSKSKKSSTSKGCVGNDAANFY